MKSAQPQRACPSQARYAQLSAILRLRIAELESALDRDEVDRKNWDHPEVLLGVDRILAEAISLLTRRPVRAALEEPGTRAAPMNCKPPGSGPRVSASECAP